MTITGQQVKAAREPLRWTQDTLAAQVRVSPSTIAHFEKDKRVPSVLIVSTIKRHSRKLASSSSRASRASALSRREAKPGAD